jgi:exonuclease III
MASILKFATLNLNNLQLPGEPMYFGATCSDSEYDEKIKWTATMLKKIDADIIAFQELWTPKCLEEAFKEAGLKNDYNLYCENTNEHRISVAAAIRKTLTGTNPTWIVNLPDEFVLKKRQNTSGDEPDYSVKVGIDNFSRPVLRITVTPEKGPDIVLFVAHLKSKKIMPLDSQENNNNNIKRHSTAIGSALSTIRRTAEAAGLRVLLNQDMRDTDTPVVVMGDLNDDQLGVITSIVTEQPRYRLFLASRVGHRSDRGLYSVATLQEYRSLRDVYYTYIYKGQRESLDHILVSEQFYDHSSNRVWSFKEMRILNDHLDDADPSTSDHGPVIATFDYKPASN